MSGAIPPLPDTPSWRGAQLKHSGNFSFTFINRNWTLIEAPVLVNGEEKFHSWTRHFWHWDSIDIRAALPRTRCLDREGATVLKDVPQLNLYKNYEAGSQYM